MVARACSILSLVGGRKSNRRLKGFQGLLQVDGYAGFGQAKLCVAWGSVQNLSRLREPAGR